MKLVAVAFITLVTATVLASPTVHAQPSLTPPQPAPPVTSYIDFDADAPEEMEVDDYRLQLLLADVGGLVLGIATQSPELWLGTYVLGAPIVHIAHGNAGHGITSLGLRVGLPTVGAMIGLGIGEQRCRNRTYDDHHSIDLCGLGEMGIGLLIGMGSAIALDALAMGKVERPAERPALLRAGGVAMNPTMAMTRDGDLSLGLQGAW